MHRYLYVLGILMAGQTDAFAHQSYTDICDASAAVPVGVGHFLVAQDEDDIIRLYANDGLRNEPLGEGFDFSEQLRTNSNRESDIEGATRLGDRVYWITSHGRNKKGKLRPNRYRLFATDLEGEGTSVELAWVGRYDRLVEDALDANSWDAYNERAAKLIANATQLDDKKVEKLAPKNDGLNIEALAAFPDGSGLLIGLRNPLSEGQALVLHLQNPDDLLIGEATKGSFGNAYFLDLDGLGLRAMEYETKSGRFLIVAGPRAGGGGFKLFRWEPGTEPVLVRGLLSESGSNPEGLVLYESGVRLQVIHDEGTRDVDGVECKMSEKQAFSDRWYDVD